MWWMASAVVLLFVALAVVPVAATELQYHNMLYIPVENIQHNDYSDGTYDFTIGNDIVNGGMNAVHISNSPGEYYGQPNRLTSRDGTFFITDTGGRGYEDDIILMIAVEKTDAADFSIDLKSEGYHGYDHAPSTAPTYTETVGSGYMSPAYQGTLTSANFLKDYWAGSTVTLNQTWRPAAPDSTDDYSGTNGYLWSNQTVNDGDFRLMFVDLNVTTTGISAYNTTYRSLLQLNGTPRISYNISPNYSGKVAFAPYAYVNFTTGGGSQFDHAIGWTNRANSTSYPSDWLVTLT